MNKKEINKIKILSLLTSGDKWYIRKFDDIWGETLYKIETNNGKEVGRFRSKEDAEFISEIKNKIDKLIKNFEKCL